MTTMIPFTAKKLDELIVAYDAAVAAGKTEFQFAGHTWLVAYAKYVIEFLSGKFKE